jgi:hypothetical protein
VLRGGDIGDGIGGRVVGAAMEKFLKIKCAQNVFVYSGKL